MINANREYVPVLINFEHFFCQILEQWAINFVKFRLIISIFIYLHHLELDSF